MSNYISGERRNDIIERSMGGLTVQNSSLNGGVDLRNTLNASGSIIGRTASVSMGGVSANNCTFQNIEVRNTADLNESSAETIEVGMGGINWINSAAKKDAFKCRSINVRNSSTLTNINIGKLECSMGGVTLNRCNADEIEARNSSSLNTCFIGRTSISMGSLSMTGGFARSINARDAVTIANADAQNVVSENSTVTAEQCQIDSIESQNTATAFRSTVEKIKVFISGSSVRLSLKESTVGNITIVKSKSTPISASYARNIVSSSGGLSISMNSGSGSGSANAIVIGGGHYNSIADIPQNLKQMALNFGNEGDNVKVGNLELVVRNGQLVSRRQEPEEETSIDEVIAEIQSMFGSGVTIGRLHHNGGIFSIKNGQIEVIQAPPGVRMPGSSASPAGESRVTVEIDGGNILGKVNFENCQGTVTCINQATVGNADHVPPLRALRQSAEVRQPAPELMTQSEEDLAQQITAIEAVYERQNRAAAQPEEKKVEAPKTETKVEEPKPTKTEEKEEKTCGICMENPINAVILPCRHLQYCLDCIQNLNKCPTCRQTITQKFQVYT